MKVSRLVMIDIRSLIKSELKTIHPRVHFLKAPETSAFPYLVYEIEITDLEDGLKLLTLDVDGWDKNPDLDSTAIEVLMEKVHANFDHKTIITDKMVIAFHTDRRLPVMDDDPTINRRKNIYTGRLFER